MAWRGGEGGGWYRIFFNHVLIFHPYEKICLNCVFIHICMDNQMWINF